MSRRARPFAAATAATIATAGVVAAAALGEPASPERGEARAEPSAASPSASKAGDGRGGVVLNRLGRFSRPVYVHGPKGANGLVFVVEQQGRIRVIRDGRRDPGSFLDIRRRVSCCGERGLLSVAFPPNYAKSGRFYVYFTDRRGDLRIQEYRRKGKKAARARPGSARNVLRVRHRAFSNHNGGQLQFGPDGLLYIGTGDGGGAGDPSENAQSKGSLLGKLLRIDPRRGKSNPYRVPRGNPFVGKKGKREIFARGLRNPWRFSFDRNKRRIALGDVGQESREEVDFEKLRRLRRANFGWDAFEGTRRFGPDGSPPPKRHDKPIHEYGHGGGNCSITGGYVVRDKRLTSLRGRYVYADYCVGQIRSLVPRTGGASGDRALGLPRHPGLSTFGEDAEGRIYAASADSGAVWRLVPKP